MTPTYKAGYEQGLRDAAKLLKCTADDYEQALYRDAAREVAEIRSSFGALGYSAKLNEIRHHESVVALLRWQAGHILGLLK